VLNKPEVIFFTKTQSCLNAFSAMADNRL